MSQKKLKHAQWENNSRSNTLRESSASGASLPDFIAKSAISIFLCSGWFLCIKSLAQNCPRVAMSRGLFSRTTFTLHKMALAKLLCFFLSYTNRLKPSAKARYIQGAFFYCSALKMTKCQPDREISELFLPKKRLRMKKVTVPELFRTVPLPKMTKEKVQVTQLL